MKYLSVDRKAAEIKKALAKAPIYRKQGVVRARLAQPGETLATTIDGKTETIKTAKAGDYVVTNPTGEVYILPGAQFLERYQAQEGTEDQWAPTGHCRAIDNPYGQAIEIIAAWGSPQRGDIDCLIADTCNAEGLLDGEPYIIERGAFTASYALDSKK